MPLFNRIQETAHCGSLQCTDDDVVVEMEEAENAAGNHAAQEEENNPKAPDESQVLDPVSDQYEEAPQQNFQTPADTRADPYFEGLSLDGRSLTFPDQGDYDDMSSINTNHFHTDTMKILGQVEPEYEAPLEGHARLGSRKATSPHASHGASPKSSAEKALDDSKESNDDGCLPLWISDAPMWLKVVIVLSVALLLGAIALVSIGAGLAAQKNKEADSTTKSSPKVPPFPTEFDTAAPTMVPMSIDDADGAVHPSVSPTRPNIEESDAATSPTSAATTVPTASTVIFYVTGGRFISEALDALPDQLASLPNEDEETVMFHLGDWNSPFATECVESSYQANVDLYSNSAVPVYFVPGDNEYNDCPDPDQAFSFWNQYILNFETQFWPAPTLWNVTRQDPEFPENFAYIHNGILFVGINLVGGLVHSNREWQDRHAANLLWIDEQYYLNEGNFEAMVILAHSDPTLRSNSNFFETFYERVEFNYQRQVIFVHRNLGVDSWALQESYNDISNLMVVVVEGSVWPPMKIQIDTKVGMVDVDQGDWYNEFLSTLP